MIVCRSTDELIRARQQRSAPWAFVPTLGNLHEGHLALVAEAARHASQVVVSIFVNPLQFSGGEDFGRYPRTLEADLAALQVAGTDVVFVPGESDIYPNGRERHTRVRVPGLSEILCGAFRPGHFEGVATVVQRLFQLLEPAYAVFGKKDYQQWQIVRRMTADLGLPVAILAVDTLRAPDGLALSSRNGYLDARERAQAPLLYATLQEVVRSEPDTVGDWTGVLRGAEARLAAHGFVPEYLVVRRQQDLEPPEPGDRALVALAAAHLGRTRLIDNIEFSRVAV